ncbi:MAG: dCTP deaminase [Patescibacteria group bacterium]|nr:MAG: dCTP deaminase [Patescibacteria group bacterium]
MILSDTTIKEMLESGELHIDPIKKESIQPASVDCHLGDHFLLIKDKEIGIISLDQEIHYEEIKEKSIVIPSHSFILATTEEYVRLPNDLTAFVEGRSSIGRIGLFIQNAGWVDPGFEGRITLELYNASSVPIKLDAGRRICQLVFCKMDKKAENPYRGKYQGQTATTGSSVNKDSEVKA